MAVARPAPGPAGLPVAGSLFAVRRDPIGFLTRTSEEYGDVVRFRLGRRHEAFFFRHPDQVRDVLVTHQHAFMKGRGLQWAKHFLGEGLLTSEGEFHTRQRRLSQPAFHRQRIHSYGKVMTDYALRTRERWRSGQDLDLGQEMMELTMAVVAKTLFDADVAGEAAKIGRSLTTIIGLLPPLQHAFLRADPEAAPAQQHPLPPGQGPARRHHLPDDRGAAEKRRRSRRFCRCSSSPPTRRATARA